VNLEMSGLRDGILFLFETQFLDFLRAERENANKVDGGSEEGIGPSAKNQRRNPIVNSLCDVSAAENPDQSMAMPAITLLTDMATLIPQLKIEEKMPSRRSPFWISSRSQTSASIPSVTTQTHERLRMTMVVKIRNSRDTAARTAPGSKGTPARYCTARCQKALSPDPCAQFADEWRKKHPGGIGDHPGNEAELGYRLLLDPGSAGKDDREAKECGEAHDGSQADERE